MAVYRAPSWERRLVALAHEGLSSRPLAGPVCADPLLLRRAYQVCEQVTRQHSRTFYLATSLLPAEKSRAVRALYAFCRVTDDLVDQPQGDSLSLLKDWRRLVVQAHPPANDPVALAWADARARYCIPHLYAEQLIDGIAQDLCYSRYATFEELCTYCYRVASTVGLMSMHIIGFSGPQAIPYAVKLGVALQMTNILRDVGEDMRNGRLYLPLEELEMFGLREVDLPACKSDFRWRRFIAFQIERNQRLYAASLPGIAFLNQDGRFATAAAAGLYRLILDDIARHQGDVFTRRAHVKTWQMLLRLPGIWLRQLG